MKNNKGFLGLGVLIAVVAVLAVGGGAYYFGAKKASTPKNTEENNYQSEEKNVQAKLIKIDGPWHDSLNEMPGWHPLYQGMLTFQNLTDGKQHEYNLCAEKLSEWSSLKLNQIYTFNTPNYYMSANTSMQTSGCLGPLPAPSSQDNY